LLVRNGIERSGSAGEVIQIREIGTGILDENGADFLEDGMGPSEMPGSRGFPFEQPSSEDGIPGRFYPGSKRRIPDHRPRPSSSQQEYPWNRPKSRTPRDPLAWDARPKLLQLNGIETEFFSIGQLATAVNRSKYTVVDWIRKGILPEARYRTPGTEHRWGKGVRLWSRAQVEAIQRIAVEEGILGEQRRYRGHTRSAAHQRFAERTGRLMRETP
jgi:hypothetical protein